MRFHLSSPRLPSLKAEDGVSLIEVLVATLLLTIGVLGLLGGFNSSRSLTLLSERHTAMAHRAQLEVERLQAASYTELAMKSAPPHSTEAANPDYYVNSAGTEYAYGTGSKETQKLVLGGVIEPGSKLSGRKCSKEIGACEWEDGKLSGDVYDFVTCGEVCTAKENYKRLTVVVTLNVPSGSKAVTPLRVSTLIANPEEAAG
jgi:hypothetical protein